MILLIQSSKTSKTIHRVELVLVIFGEWEECNHSEYKKNFWNASNVLDLDNIGIVDTSTSLSCTFMSFILFCMYSSIYIFFDIYNFKDLQNVFTLPTEKLKQNNNKKL